MNHVGKQTRTKLLAVVLCLALIVSLLTITAKEVKAADTTSDLVAHWSFDGDLTESANSLLTNEFGSSVTFVEGVLGKAIEFNGINNYLVVPHNQVLDLGNTKLDRKNQLTISFWVYHTGLDMTDDTILNKGEDSGWDEQYIHYWSDPYSVKVNGNYTYLELNNDLWDKTISDKIITEGQVAGRDDTGASIDGSEWQLVTYTYDGKTVKMYCDKQLLKEYEYGEGFALNEEPLYIGVDGKTKLNFFAGRLDDLRIYQRALGKNDVDALYEAGLKESKELLEPTKQLVAYYTFNDELKDSSSFKNDAKKVVGDGKIEYVKGMKGNAVRMTGGAYISVPAADQLNFDDEVTFMFWVKHEADSQNTPIITRLNDAKWKDGTEESATYQVTASVASGDNYFANIGMYNLDLDSWTNGQLQDAEIHIGVGKHNEDGWGHYTFTYAYNAKKEYGTYKIYFNGELIEEEDEIPISDIANGIGELRIGNYPRNNGTKIFEGAVDEIKIYNKCLSDAEVKKEAGVAGDTLAIKDEASRAKDNVITIKKGKQFKVGSVIFNDADTGKSKTIKASSSKVTFKTSKKSIFTVSSKGVIKAKKKGTAKLTVTYDKDTTVIYTIKVK